MPQDASEQPQPDAAHEDQDAAEGMDAAEEDPDAAEGEGDAAEEEADAAEGDPDAAPEPRNFRGVYPLNAEHPEGGIYDPVDHVFYVGSLVDGSVRRVDANTGQEEIYFSPDEPGTWWTLGMVVDEDRRRLLVCAMDDRREQDDQDPPYDGYVWEFDLVTGERTDVYDLGDASDDATCTDVTVTEAGVVYVCDRENPRIYEIGLDGEIDTLVDDDILSAAVIGQNGLLTLPDQSGLLSLIYLPSRLVHVRLPDGALTEVDIDGDFFDGLPPLSGADGMAWDGDSVLVAFTSQLNRISPTLGDWSRAESETVDVPGGQTDVVITPGGAYLLNGQAVDFAFGRDTDPFELVLFLGDL